MINELKTKLEEYCNFQQGWDGYRGKCFSVEFMNKCVRCAEEIVLFMKTAGLTVTNISPCPASDGSVDFEVETNKQIYRVTFILYPDKIKI